MIVIFVLIKKQIILVPFLNQNICWWLLFSCHHFQYSATEVWLASQTLIPQSLFNLINSHWFRLTVNYAWVVTFSFVVAGGVRRIAFALFFHKMEIIHAVALKIIQKTSSCWLSVNVKSKPECYYELIGSLKIGKIWFLHSCWIFGLVFQYLLLWHRKMFRRVARTWLHRSLKLIRFYIVLIPILITRDWNWKWRC